MQIWHCKQPNLFIFFPFLLLSRKMFACRGVMTITRQFKWVFSLEIQEKPRVSWSLTDSKTFGGRDFTHARSFDRLNQARISENFFFQRLLLLLLKSCNYQNFMKSSEARKPGGKLFQKVFVSGIYSKIFRQNNLTSFTREVFSDRNLPFTFPSGYLRLCFYEHTNGS